MKSRRSLIMFFIVLLPFITFGGIVLLKPNAQPPSMCGGEITTVQVTAEGFVDKHNTRSTFNDPQTDWMWYGGGGDEQGGLLRVFDPITNHYAVCQHEGKPIEGFTINEIRRSGQFIVVSTDGNGTFLWDGAVFKHIVTGDEPKDDTYTSSVDPADGNIVVGTRAGLYKIQGNSLELFREVPPDGMCPVHAIEFVSETEFWIGCVESGTFHYVNGEWLLLLPEGIRKYGDKGWMPAQETGEYPVKIRDIYRKDDGTIILAADLAEGETKQSGLTVIEPGKKPYRIEHPSSPEAFWNLVNYTPYGESGFAVMNWNKEAMAGTYFTRDGKDFFTLTKLPSYDSIVFSTSAYIGTSEGVLRVELPRPPADTMAPVETAEATEAQ